MEKKTQTKTTKPNPIWYWSSIKELMSGFAPVIDKVSVQSVSQAWQFLGYTVTALSNTKEAIN